jgi:hypothetical protein
MYTSQKHLTMIAICPPHFRVFRASAKGVPPTGSKMTSTPAAQHCSAVHVQLAQSHGHAYMQYGKTNPWFSLQHVTSTMSLNMVS